MSTTPTPEPVVTEPAPVEQPVTVAQPVLAEQPAIVKPDRATTLDSLLSDGTTPDQLMADLRARAEALNKASQASVPTPPDQPHTEWQTRKAFVLDGQAIHGHARGLADFYFPARAAMARDDQAGYSQGCDLLMKALRTALGDDPPPEPMV